MFYSIFLVNFQILRAFGSKKALFISPYPPPTVHPLFSNASGEPQVMFRHPTGTPFLRYLTDT